VPLYGRNLGSTSGNGRVMTACTTPHHLYRLQLLFLLPGSVTIAAAADAFCGRRDPARDGLPLRRQPRLHALTGNYKDDMVHMPDRMQRLLRVFFGETPAPPFPSLRSAGSRTVLAVLGVLGLVLVLRAARRRARHDLAVRIAWWSCWPALSNPVPDRGQHKRSRRGAGGGRRFDSMRSASAASFQAGPARR